MFNKASHSQNILETGIATVTSSGHWFNIGRQTIDDVIPGLLGIISFENLVKEAVAWAESPDNLTLVLYFALLLQVDAVTALFLTLAFYFFWYTFKSFFVRRGLSPVMKFLSLDILQVVLAAVVLSYLGMTGAYTALIIGVVYFFLFKVGLMRVMLSWLNRRRVTDALPLNDKLICALLHRYSRKADVTTVSTGELERVIRQKLAARKS